MHRADVRPRGGRVGGVPQAPSRASRRVRRAFQPAPRAVQVPRRSTRLRGRGRSGSRCCRRERVRGGRRRRRARRVRRARERGPARWTRAARRPGRRCRAEERRVDVVWAGDVVEHVGRPWRRWLSELRRVLRPGGDAAGDHAATHGAVERSLRAAVSRRALRRALRAASDARALLLAAPRCAGCSEDLGFDGRSRARPAAARIADAARAPRPRARPARHHASRCAGQRAPACISSASWRRCAGSGVDVVEAANDAPPRARRRRVAQRPATWRLDAWWTQVELPRRARAAPTPTCCTTRCPALARRRACPQVVTVHDLAFERLPERFDARLPALRRGRAPRGRARAADAVVCVSRDDAPRTRWRAGASTRSGSSSPATVPARSPPPSPPPARRSTSSTSATTSRARTSALLLDAHARYRDAPARTRSRSSSPAPRAPRAGARRRAQRPGRPTLAHLLRRRGRAGAPEPARGLRADAAGGDERRGARARGRDRPGVVETCADAALLRRPLRRRALADAHEPRRRRRGSAARPDRAGPRAAPPSSPGHARPARTSTPIRLEPTG